MFWRSKQPLTLSRAKIAAKQAFLVDFSTNLNKMFGAINHFGLFSESNLPFGNDIETQVANGV